MKYAIAEILAIITLSPAFGLDMKMEWQGMGQ